MFFFAKRYIAHLEAEVEHLRGQVRYHENRADVALAELAASKSGKSVSGPAPAQPYVAPDVMAEVRRQMEADGMTNAGAIIE